MTAPETAQVGQTRGRLVLANWGPTILFNIALPLLTYFVLTSRGVPAVAALLVSGGWPLVEFGLSLALVRRLDEFAVLSLVFIALGVIAGVGFNSARLVLVKESIVTGLFGLVTLGSLALPRPLMFYFGRKFATNGTLEEITRWNELWQYSSFRRTQRVITVVWGVVFLVEALLRIGLSYTLSTSVMTVVSSILPFVVIGSLVFWTFGYGRRAKAAALAALPAPMNGVD
jgi:intracellular septation protein A